MSAQPLLVDAVIRHRATLAHVLGQGSVSVREWCAAMDQVTDSCCIAHSTALRSLLLCPSNPLYHMSRSPVARVMTHARVMTRARAVCHVLTLSRSISSSHCLTYMGSDDR